MDHLQYFGLLFGCLVVTLPLEFLYGFRVWRDPMRLARTIFPVLVIFVVWDLVAINREHWFFNPKYVTGIELPGGMPIEEFCFFVIIPAAAVSGYEAVRHSMAKRRSRA